MTTKVKSSHSTDVSTTTDESMHTTRCMTIHPVGLNGVQLLRYISAPELVSLCAKSQDIARVGDSYDSSLYITLKEMKLLHYCLVCRLRSDKSDNNFFIIFMFNINITSAKQIIHDVLSNLSIPSGSKT